jgi:hypothetical protein
MGVRKPDLIFVRLGVVLLPMIIGGVIWVSVREQGFSTAAPRSPRLIVSPPGASAPKPGGTGPKAAARDAPNASSNAARVAPPPLTAIVLASTPFARVPTDLVSEPDIATAAPELLFPEPGTRAPAAVDPRKLREMMDRGVVAYASASTREGQARGAKLIQLAAQLGYGPARDLIARNYPRSEAMQSVVPAADAVRYTLPLVTDEARESDDSKAIFAALVEHAAASGTMRALARQLVDALRADRRPRLSHRLDVILALLARTRGACSAVAQVIATTNDGSEGECSPALSQGLLSYIQSTGGPVGGGPEARRGL